MQYKYKKNTLLAGQAKITSPPGAVEVSFKKQKGGLG